MRQVEISAVFLLFLFLIVMVCLGVARRGSQEVQPAVGTGDYEAVFISAFGTVEPYAGCQP
jgi:hypothetical protein